MIVTTQPGTFGMPIIRAYINCMKNIYTTRGVRGLFEVSNLVIGSYTFMYNVETVKFDLLYLL